MSLVKTISAVSACCLLALSGSAVEYFADPVFGNDAYDGLAALYDGTHGPKKSAQAAVDLAEVGTILAAPNTVTLLPGDYRPAGDAASCVNVQAPIRLRSQGGRAGRDVTRIWGALDPDGANGCGPAAVRCLSVSASAQGCIVEGLTLAGGATKATGSSADADNAGGGVYSPATNVVTLVDCAVVGCRALYGGGASRVTAVRTLFARNGATTLGAASYWGHHYNCVFAGNENLTVTESVSIASYPVHMINCTFCGNRSNTSVMANGSSETVVANCLITLNGQFKTVNVGTKTSSLKKRLRA